MGAPTSLPLSPPVPHCSGTKTSPQGSQDHEISGDGAPSVCRLSGLAPRASPVPQSLSLHRLSPTRLAALEPCAESTSCGRAD